MNFVPQLRMNNIMPGGGNNPFGAPEISQPFDMNAMINAMQTASSNRRLQDQQQEDNLHRRAMTEHLQEVARQVAMQRQGPSNMGPGGNMPPNIGGMNTSYGGEIPQTILNGETLQQASARVDADNENHLSVQPQYIPAEDQPGSQKSRLEMLGKQISGQQANAATAQTNAMARQNLSGSQAMERTNAETASREKIANTNNTNKIALDKQKADEKAAADAKKVSDKLAADTAKGNQRKEVANKMTQDALDAINDIIDEKGNLKDTVGSAVGMSRMNPLNMIPGSQAQTANSTLDNFSGKVLLNLLNEVKSQSASGATGFGNMSNKDLDTLKQAASRLNKSMPKEDYAKEVVRLRDLMKTALSKKTSDGTDNKKHDGTAQGMIDFYSKEND
jgi:hypothetical protein